MKLSLVISAYNQHDSLAKVLRGISLQTSPPDEILIADDGSTDPTRQLIDQWRRQNSIPLQHLWHPDNGFLKTTILNKCVLAASGQYLVFLDGDCVPHPSYIADHRALAQTGYWVQGRRCFIRQPFVSQFQPGQTSTLLWAIRGRISRPHKAFRLPFPIIVRDMKQRGIIGCNMAHWRENILEVNGFDESYVGRGMGADSDLGTRLYNLGIPRKFVYGRALVFHLDHPIMPRPHFAENKARLLEVIRTGKTRATRGISERSTLLPV